MVGMSKSIHEQYVSGRMGAFQEFDWFFDMPSPGQSESCSDAYSSGPINDSRYPLWTPFRRADMFTNGNCVSVERESVYRLRRYRDETQRVFIEFKDLYRILSSGPAGEYILVGA